MQGINFDDATTQTPIGFYMNPLQKKQEELFGSVFTVIENVFTKDEVDVIIKVISRANTAFRKTGDPHSV